MKYIHQKGFSIVLAIGVVLLLSLTGLYLVEYMIPFSRNIKGIENASQAFYESYSGVEENVFKVYSGSLGVDYNKTFSGLQDYSYSFTGSSTIIPAIGQGNSEDSNYSRLSQNEGISLDIGGNPFDSGGSIDLYLKVPNGSSFEAPISDEIILVQLSGTNGALSSASGALIRKSDVTDSTLDLLARDGVTLSGLSRTFRQYYGDLGCESSGAECTLKISVINPLVSNISGAPIPYLEYRIETSSSVPYPNPLMSSQGKSYGFSKTLEVFIPQESTNSAFDFTVLQ